MKRLFAAVAISALTLSSAAFAADVVQKPVDQKAQVPAASAPAVTSTTPAKPGDASQAKKPAVKKEKTSLNMQRPAAIQQAQATTPAAPAKSMTDSGTTHGKKAETVKKSDG